MNGETTLCMFRYSWRPLQKESEEAAKVYAEFVASFENDRNGQAGQAFVKAGSSMASIAQGRNIPQGRNGSIARWTIQWSY